MRRKLYQIKEWVKMIWKKQPLAATELNYDDYWDDKRGDQLGMLSIWQEQRAHLTLDLLSHEKEPISMADVGCGDGVILRYLSTRIPFKQMIGVDVSAPALKRAEAAGIKTIQANLGDPKALPQLPHPDYVMMYEFLEHIQHSESFLLGMYRQVKKGVLFSVPNSGFFPHRFRLLFGHFFLQWRIFPGEHLRYWTVPDMKWWLKSLGLRNYTIKYYEGVPVLNQIWPSMFAAGMLVLVRKADIEERNKKQ